MYISIKTHKNHKYPQTYISPYIIWPLILFVMVYGIWYVVCETKHIGPLGQGIEYLAFDAGSNVYKSNLNEPFETCQYPQCTKNRVWIPAFYIDYSEYKGGY